MKAILMPARGPVIGIYRFRNTISGRCYVGSSANVHQRRRAHLSQLRRGNHHCGHLQRAWVKFGPDAFEFELLAVSQTVDGLEILETSAISDHRMTCGVYNIAPVGGTTRGVKLGPLSAEHRAKIGAARRGRKSSPETCAAIGCAHRGKTISAEHRAAVARAARERVHSDETRQKLRVAATDPSAKTRAKRSAAMKRTITAERLEAMRAHGANISPETRVKRAESMRRAWLIRRISLRLGL